MSVDTDYIRAHAPDGATHYGRYKTGKLFYALEFYNQSKSALDYLEWFDVQQRFYSVTEHTDTLKELI